jgi:hypothetical protein
MCQTCNRERLDGQSTKIKPSQFKNIVKMSTATKNILLEYSKTIKRIDEEREPVCSGCGKSTNLSNSHLISRQKCRDLGRLDLIYDEENIQKHCLMNSLIPNAGHKGCHEIFESDPELRPLMLDYVRNVGYVVNIVPIFAKRFFNL